jgi:hypothetical protein
MKFPTPRIRCALLFATLLWAGAAAAVTKDHAVERGWITHPPAPKLQSWPDADSKSAGCISCHTEGDARTMHVSEAVVLGCTDCHGGNASVLKPAGSSEKDQAPHHGHAHDDPSIVEKHGNPGYKYTGVYAEAMESAHVLPRFPDRWDYPRARNPERTYALLNKEAPEFIRFINPGDLRIAEEACGSCHLPIIEAAKRSIMATGAMLWGGASYNNGILPYKRYILGESYTRDGKPAAIKNPIEVTEEMAKRGILPILYPLPAWEVIPPGDIFRIFERGGRNINTTFPETGLPNSLGQIQRLEEPGRPDIKQSNRGPGTGQRIAVPVINIHKTRLNDPNMWFMGTNDQPGDYRHSGCTACHVPYANDRDSRHSGPYAQFGHEGKTQTSDPTIPKDASGHPIRHAFTRSVPTSQCMICHMHQPNMFMNTYLGYTMWDYESDAPFMWPEKQKYPSHEEMREILDRNPEEAAIRGKWGDLDFLKGVWELNPQLKDTQFADYHGHGWNFRGIFKRDRKGNLLDAEGTKVAHDDPKKWDKAVHMSSIHVDVGMHCVDCHFSQDMHGNGHIVGEVMAGVEIMCKDCHGTADNYPTLLTSGPMASGQGRNLANMRNPDGKKRFEWIGDKLIQRSLVNPGMEWEMSLVKDSVTPGNAHYNEKAARAKLMSQDTATQHFGTDVAPADRAHKDDEMLCYTCHLSWTTSCGGCHLPIQANWKTKRHHYEDTFSRNYATYNPQVARDDVFILGRHGEIKNFVIAPIRSTSALVLSSTNSNRERIYIQQPPIASSGYSSQAFAPHYPHTERKTETKMCSDCHLSETGDNNAIMAQTLGHGTRFMDLYGFMSYVGGDGEVSAIRVTEWDEPQAVVGSFLHRYAYPDWYNEHQQRGRKLTEGHHHSSGLANCIQNRGEYLYVAEGKNGARIYDIASVANKGVSQRIITAPFSELGHDANLESPNATCIALATTQPVQPSRNEGDLMRKVNLEQPFADIYRYALVTDSVEGLIVLDIDTLYDGEPRNNFVKRALTWNEGGVLDGARFLYIAGSWVYVLTPTELVVLDLHKPLEPKVASRLPLADPRALQVQFRYAFVTTGKGLQVVEITDPRAPRLIEQATVALEDARRVHVARTYAYVAAGREGLVIVDVEKPEQPKIYQRFTADGRIDDARDVSVATTNASLMAYVADGKNGLKVLQLTSPSTQPNFYGFSPEPKPELIAWYPTSKPAVALGKALERDRAVDESGGQVAVLGRVGARPFNDADQKSLYLDEQGKPWYVTDDIEEARRRLARELAAHAERVKAGERAGSSP